MSEPTMDENRARRLLMQVILQRQAAEFVAECVWGDGMFTQEADGRIVIIDGETTKAWIAQATGTDAPPECPHVVTSDGGTSFCSLNGPGTDEVVAILRAMYRQQAETDENGGREVAAWYYLDQLEAATGASLDPEAQS